MVILGRDAFRREPEPLRQMGCDHPGIPLLYARPPRQPVWKTLFFQFNLWFLGFDLALLGLVLWAAAHYGRM
jgi:hypothetical protein